MAASLGRGLGASVAVVTVLNTLSALSMPVRGRRAGLPLILFWLALLAAHSALYWFGDRFRARFDLRAYAIAQGAVVFALAVTPLPTPVVIALFMALTAEMVVLSGARWGATAITIGAISMFVVAALIKSDLYQATTAGLALAVTGVVAHAIAGLARQRAGSVAIDATATPERVVAETGGLSARELEVLRELVSGARNSEIATRLGISERTVKSHLKSIYQKLAVESRAGAVAAAIQRGLV